MYNRRVTQSDQVVVGAEHSSEVLSVFYNIVIWDADIDAEGFVQAIVLVNVQLMFPRSSQGVSVCVHIRDHVHMWGVWGKEERGGK